MQQSHDGESKYLAIAVGGETFGIPLLRIKEIIEYKGMTAVPMMPECVPGAINLRGHSVPVLDLSLRLGKQPTETGLRTCVVIVETTGVHGHTFDVGLLVDSVTEVVDIDSATIEPTPSFDGVLRTDFLKGMGRIEERLVVLLDLDRLLSMKDMEQWARGENPVSEAKRLDEEVAA